MSLAIVGSRDFEDFSLLCEKVNELRKEFKITHIISGGAKGADILAEKYAKEYNLSITILKPDWDKFGKKAGILRNKDIINLSDYIIAFWDGESPGTKNAIETANKYNKPIKVIIIS